MSDVLLAQISKQLGDIHATLKGGAAPVAAPKTTTVDPAKAAADAAKKADVKKKADAAAAASAKTTTAAKPAGPAAGAKAPGGKHTVEQVRDAIRKVAANASLGKESAKEILKDDGGGVERVLDLKPENYDKVFEACTVLLASEGAPATAAEPEDDLM